MRKETMEKKKNRKNRLDEMQEQKLLQIEHNGCWLAFWGLGIALVVQWCLGAEQREVAGEWIVFVCLSLYITIACLKNGIWDRKLDPTPKVNLFASLLAGVIVGIVFFSTSYAEYHALLGSIATGIFMLGVTAGICFAAISAVAALYRKKVEKLETEDDEENHRDE